MDTKTTDMETAALAIATAELVKLTPEQSQNVLLYLNSRFGGQVVQPKAFKTSEQKFSSDGLKEIGDYFDMAKPKTEPDRVLVAAYGLQEINGLDRLESFAINHELKQLGQGAGNITRALGWLEDQKPALMMQVGKSGKAKQARKAYKLTREGSKRVQLMLSQKEGVTNDQE